MISLGLCSSSDVITFDQNWHHPYSTSAGGKDPEICSEILSEKLRAKFPATTPDYSMAKIACLDDAFLEVFAREASPAEGQSPQQEDKKRRKRKGKTGIKHGASGKIGPSSCSKCLFE